MQQQLFEDTGNILPFNGEVLLFPNAFTPEESNTFLSTIIQQTPWKHEAITMFGKQVMQPRFTAWYGDAGKSYSYSGITMQPLTWNDTLTQVKTIANNIAGVVFNSALLNYYRDGNDSMGWHRDNESALGINPVIASVSFGVARKFQLRHYGDKAGLTNIVLTHGSLLLMRGQTQHYWEHQLSKVKGNMGARVNITFRVII